MAPLPTSRLRRSLLAWYDRERRDLPWRRGGVGPYAIWVSEVMLQQTRVATALTRWRIFLDRFPTVQRLADAHPAEVCEAWAGLGYYRRALSLHAAATQVCRLYDGRLPNDPEQLRGLPGIGEYTAGAVASIAYGRREPAVDGNVARVLTRVLGRTATADSRESVSLLRGYARRLVQCRRPGDINQALMDLGSLLCTPRAPECRCCPWRRVCRARAWGDPERFGSRRSPARRRRAYVAYAMVRPRSGGLWLEQRPLEGLWAGMWEPPSSLCEFRVDAERQLAGRLRCKLEARGEPISHTLSHLQIEARWYRPISPVRLRPSRRRRVFDSPADAALSALARKAIVGARQSG